MACEVISNPGELSGLEPQWRELYASDPRSTPFQSPDWLLPWWEAFGSGHLLTVAIRDGLRLVALAPMFIHTWNGRRQVTLIGNGLSDRLGVLLRPDYEHAAMCETFKVLKAVSDLWDLCDFQDLGPDDPFAQGPVSPGFKRSLEDQYPNLAIPLPPTTEQFDASLSSSIRRNLTRYRRQLAAHGNPAYETAASPGAFNEGFDALLRFHKIRRNDDGQGAFTECEEHFHRTAARRFFFAGEARLALLRVDREVIAATYLVVHSGRAYACLGAFDPAMSKFRPGWLILDFAIGSAISEGLLAFDFLRGEEEYKKHWGAVRYTTRRLHLWNEHSTRPAP
jgi:CelD/BcsL family acetyltransferase involved in cellulose biosynthesis